MKKGFVFLLFIVHQLLSAQVKDTLSLLFVGDIMGHSPQITSAYNKQTKRYEYEPVFAKVAPIFRENDFVVANLEVTLGGKPYTGYPTFSSPKGILTPTLVLSAKPSKLIKINVKTIKIFFMFPPSST